MSNTIEVIFSLGLFFNAALFVPQANRLLKNKDSKEVSFITFFGFLLIQLTTLSHAILKNDLLLMYGTIASMLTCGYVTFLIIYYRVKSKKYQ